MREERKTQASIKCQFNWKAVEIVLHSVSLWDMFFHVVRFAAVAHLINLALHTSLKWSAETKG